MISGIALTCVQDDQEYLVGPWRLWERQDVGADIPTDELGQPVNDQGSLLLYDPQALFQTTQAEWVIILGPYGQRGPHPAAPDGAPVTTQPAGRQEDSATVNFVGPIAGAYEADFLLYAGEGDVPSWRDDPADVTPVEQEPISSSVLEHIDAVTAAVREILQSEGSAIEALFFDGLVDQLAILREHVEASAPTPRPHSVLRYLEFVRRRLSAAVNEIPTIAAQVAHITRAITEILQIAG